MSYGSAAALRAALEHRLQAEAQETGVALNRLRRRVVFERIVSRMVPRVLPDPPVYWEDQYARLVVDLTVEARTLTEALELLRRWWQQAISYLES